MRLFMRWLVSLAMLIMLIIIGAIFSVQSAYTSRIMDEQSMGTSPTVGIVFGAGLNPDGTPREMLEARVIKGIELLQAGKVGKLLFTGAVDPGHNEPDAMKKYAVDHGVREDQILADHKGDNTFDSCRNAVRRNLTLNKDISAVLITQRFHLPRALYLCSRLGVQSIGVPAASADSKIESLYARREYAASIKAWLQINLPQTRPYFEK